MVAREKVFLLLPSMWKQSLQRAVPSVSRFCKSKIPVIFSRIISPFNTNDALSLNKTASFSTFVSKHYTVASATAIAEFLDRKKIVHSTSGTHYKIRECPFCHDIKDAKNNMFKLYVQKQEGVYFCHRCGSTGSWMKFKQLINDPDGNHSHIHSAMESVKGISPQIVQPLGEVQAGALQQNLKSDDFTSVLQYLTQVRGLKASVLELYGVGCLQMPLRVGDAVALDWITFPWMTRPIDLELMQATVHTEDNAKSNSTDINQFQVVRVKARCMTDKSKQLLLPKGGCWGLFGWNTIPNSATEIIVTEGEYDAMAVHQATGRPAISLPNGCSSLPPNVLPLLERFETIILWMDNDIPGQENVMKFSQKLGLRRCRIVKPTGNEYLSEEYKSADPKRGNSPKDANEAMLRGFDLEKILETAQVQPHAQITTFEDMRQEVFRELLDPIAAAGIQSRHFPTLNKLLKGHRRGEVSVVTGPTGCGKTTFLSQLSLDYCEQGVNTLWGSFEIKNTRLLKKMLNQTAGVDLSEAPRHILDRTANDFEQLPMYFMRFFGSSDVDEVLDAMEHAVYAYDVKHIILDNLQFMMSGQGKGFDKFERQDAALDKFRKFASSQNVHLSLVIHPRKEQEDSELSVASVFGTAKATQEADNVMILQRRELKQEGTLELKLDVRKNRFDGTRGSMPLTFDIPSTRLLDEEAMEANELTSTGYAGKYIKEDDHNEQSSTKEYNIQTLESSQEEYESGSEQFELEQIDVLPFESEPFAKFTQIIHH